MDLEKILFWAAWAPWGAAPLAALLLAMVDVTRRPDSTGPWVATWLLCHLPLVAYQLHLAFRQPLAPLAGWYAADTLVLAVLLVPTAACFFLCLLAARTVRPGQGQPVASGAAAPVWLAGFGISALALWAPLGKVAIKAWMLPWLPFGGLGFLVVLWASSERLGTDSARWREGRRTAGGFLGVAITSHCLFLVALHGRIAGWALVALDPDDVAGHVGALVAAGLAAALGAHAVLRVTRRPRWVVGAPLILLLLPLVHAARSGTAWWSLTEGLELPVLTEQNAWPTELVGAREGCLLVGPDRVARGDCTVFGHAPVALAPSTPLTDVQPGERFLLANRLQTLPQPTDPTYLQHRVARDAQGWSLDGGKLSFDALKATLFALPRLESFAVEASPGIDLQTFVDLCLAAGDRSCTVTHPEPRPDLPPLELDEPWLDGCSHTEPIRGPARLRGAFRPCTAADASGARSSGRVRTGGWLGRDACVLEGLPAPDRGLAPPFPVRRKAAPRGYDRGDREPHARESRARTFRRLREGGPRPHPTHLDDHGRSRHLHGLVRRGHRRAHAPRRQPAPLTPIFHADALRRSLPARWCAWIRNVSR